MAAPEKALSGERSELAGLSAKKEAGMDWLRGNWFWIVVGILFIWAHTKMHGAHGGHGGHGSGGGHGGHGGHESGGGHSGGCGGGTTEDQNEARG